MKQTLLSLFILYCASSFAQAPTIEWQKSLGGTGEDVTTDMIQTLDGGYLAVGRTKSNDYYVTGNHLYTNEFGEQSPTWDAWVVKLSPTGTIEWSKAFGGSGNDDFYSVIQNPDGTYCALGTTSLSTDGDVGLDYDAAAAGAAWCVKFSPVGEIIWTKALTSDILGTFMPAWGATDIIRTSTGDIILVTSGYMYINDGLSYEDALIVKMNQLGQIIWQTKLGHSYHDYFESITETTDGGFILVGNTTINYFAEESMLFDYWIAKIDNNGNFLWDKVYGGTGYEFARDIKQTPDGGFIVCGYTSSNNGDISGNHPFVLEGGEELFYEDYWILKLNSVGDMEWQKCFGGSGSEEASSILIDNDGNYVITGYSNSEDGDVSNNIATWDVWIIKISPIGELLWEKTYGGNWWDNSASIIKTQDGGYALAADTYSTEYDVYCDFPEPYCNFWIVKLTADTLETSDLKTSAFSFFPNPTSDYITWDHENFSLQSAIIYDNTGKIVLEIHNPSQKIDVSSLSTGIYFLEAKSNEKNVTYKFIKKS